MLQSQYDDAKEEGNKLAASLKESTDEMRRIMVDNQKQRTTLLARIDEARRRASALAQDCEDIAARAPGGAAFGTLAPDPLARVGASASPATRPTPRSVHFRESPTFIAPAGSSGAPRPVTPFPQRDPSAASLSSASASPDALHTLSARSPLTPPAGFVQPVGFTDIERLTPVTSVLDTAASAARIVSDVKGVLYGDAAKMRAVTKIAYEIEQKRGSCMSPLVRLDPDSATMLMRVDRAEDVAGAFLHVRTLFEKCHEGQCIAPHSGKTVVVRPCGPDSAEVADVHIHIVEPLAYAGALVYLMGSEALTRRFNALLLSNGFTLDDFRIL